ncbi:unnamed protein product [Cuscuta campestris]|uniref:CCHC-type domain-containing protein n=1 Tax=Cuscuta campestris TaxID=132261 RepID=A0A484KJS3_9ASTE|nr:unnamed protein product [Cuscuta campestris]
MFDRFLKIINDLHVLGKTYSNKDLVRKILRSLTPEWRSKADAIYESIGNTNVTIDGLRGNLKTYESTILKPSLDKSPGLTLKASSSKRVEVSDSGSDDHNPYYKLLEKFQEFLKEELGSRDCKRKGEPVPTCFGCGELGHIKPYCPNRKEKKKKERAYMAWDSESSGDETATLCLMAHERNGEETRRELIVFTDRDLPATCKDHSDPLVITMDINGVDVARVLVDTGSSVNILPGINKARAIISIPHLCMKFHTPGGVGEVKGDQRNARECYARAVKEMTKGVNVISQEITKGETREKLEPEAETVEIELHPGDPSRTVRIGANLLEDLKVEITRVLQEYASIFAWSVADMPGIDRSIICHRLALRDGSRPPTEQWWEMAVDGASGPKGYGEFKIAQIPRAENADADLLSKLTLDAPEHVSKLVRVEILDRSSIEKLEVVTLEAAKQSNRSNTVGVDDHWMDDLLKYLTDGSKTQGTPFPNH